MTKEKGKALVPEAPAREISFEGGKRGVYARRDTGVSKERITIMLDSDVLEHFRALASARGAAPYQTQINSALRGVMAASEKSRGDRAELLDDEEFVKALAERVRAYLS